jgi:hypothetical protein
MVHCNAQQWPEPRPAVVSLIPLSRMPEGTGEAMTIDLVRRLLVVALAALAILVVLPAAVAAQAASGI